MIREYIIPSLQNSRQERTYTRTVARIWTGYWTSGRWTCMAYRERLLCKNAQRTSERSRRPDRARRTYLVEFDRRSVPPFLLSQDNSWRGDRPRFPVAESSASLDMSSALSVPVACNGRMFNRFLFWINSLVIKRLFSLY